MPRACAIVLQPPDPPSPALLAAERLLAALVVEAGWAEGQVEVLSHELAAFELRYREATGPAFGELDKAQRLVRRLQRLEDEVGRLGAVSRGEAEVTELQPHELSSGRSPRAAGRQVRGAGTQQERRAALRVPTPEAAPPEDLKTLYRRLARLLHPDLIQGEAVERAR
ncbi:MAG TPA: J domain-containing protein, partial [Anaeromyxobacteraceae bacterium]